MHIIKREIEREREGGREREREKEREGEREKERDRERERERERERWRVLGPPLRQAYYPQYLTVAYLSTRIAWANAKARQVCQPRCLRVLEPRAYLNLPMSTLDYKAISGVGVNDCSQHGVDRKGTHIPIRTILEGTVS